MTESTPRTPGRVRATNVPATDFSETTGNISTPAQAWEEMRRGNERFVAGKPAHPRQDVERREALKDGQAPHAALFGCSDSRLAAEIIFDKGIGDLFVVRMPAR